MKPKCASWRLCAQTEALPGREDMEAHVFMILEPEPEREPISLFFLKIDPASSFYAVTSFYMTPEWEGQTGSAGWSWGGGGEGKGEPRPF